MQTSQQIFWYLRSKATQYTTAVKRFKKAHTETALTLRWVPGHQNVAGNEKSDEEAKKAAQGQGSIPSKLPKCLRSPLPKSVSKIKQAFAAELKERAGELWRASPRHEKISNIDPSLPSGAFAKLVNELPRRHASVLFQLRTQTAPLQRHMWRIGRVDDAVCPTCGNGVETVHHYLMVCEVYERARWKLRMTLGRAAGCLRDLLTEEKALRALFTFIHATRRFHAVYGNLTLPKKDEDEEDGGKGKGGKRGRRGQQRGTRG